MQTQNQIRQMLDSAELAPRKRFGQCFLIDLNLMGKLVELADIKPDQIILEVGPGTGSLTDELLARAQKVVAVEIDRGLVRLLRKNFADRKNFVLIEGDAMAGKHHILPAALAELGRSASLVANLPYNIATPLIAECLMSSWCASAGRDSKACLFESLTFTVQREVADRLTARVGQDAYGQVSVLTALLGNVTLGPIAPPEAFWPAPKVASRIIRIDFNPRAAAQITDLDSLINLLNMAFSQRRKQIGSLIRRKGLANDAEQFAHALKKAEIAPDLRPGAVSPHQYFCLATEAGLEFGDGS